MSVDIHEVTEAFRSGRLRAVIGGVESQVAGYFLHDEGNLGVEVVVCGESLYLDLQHGDKILCAEITPEAPPKRMSEAEWLAMVERDEEKQRREDEEN